MKLTHTVLLALVFQLLILVAQADGFSSSKKQADLVEPMEQVKVEATPKPQALKKSKDKKTNSKKAPADPLLAVFNEVIAKYDSSSSIESKIVRKVKPALVGKEKSYQGKIYWSAKKFRWETETPEKSLILSDSDYVWNVNYPSAAFPEDVQVSRSKLDPKKEKALVMSSFKNMQTEFEIEKTEKLDSKIVFHMKEKNKKGIFEDFSMIVDEKQKLISELSYTDDVGNKTTIQLSETQFNSKLSQELFQYKAPKGVKVQDL